MMKWFKKRQSDKKLSRRARLIILPVFVSIGAAAVILAALSIVFTPKINPGSQRGVGANGFQAYVEEGSDLGMGTVVKKNDVIDVLGNKAKIVSNVDVSKVMNIDGNRGQTATYDFVRSDGVKCSVYIDVMMFKNSTDLNAANVTKDTLKTSIISGGQGYYLHAMTLSSDREYRLMITKGLNVYKFVVVQPYRSIKISEVAAMAAMKKLAAKADI